VPPGMRTGSPMGGALNAERGGGARSAMRAAAGDDPAKKKKTDLRKVMPEVWKLIRPRRWLLLFGLCLVGIKSAASFVLPITSKYLLDDVFHQHRRGILLPLVLVVLAATVVQAITSYSLTQLLSKAAQRMITELREQVQTHIGRLPISFYDTNRTGVLVSRIMTDVEGIRNLVGTGLVEFMGGIVTALVAFFILLSISARMTVILFAILLIFVVRSRGALPSRWEASASSRATTLKSARRVSSLRVSIACSTTSSHRLPLPACWHSPLLL
jgi:ABC-type bacteriocin/lantibiotic exporter with double-glycine peptidase domain